MRFTFLVLALVSALSCMADITATWTLANNLSFRCMFFLRHDKEPLPQGIR